MGCRCLAVSLAGVIGSGGGTWSAPSCITVAAENLESGRGTGRRSIGLLDTGTDRRAASDECDIGENADLQSKSSNSSRASAKIVKAVGPLGRSSEMAPTGTDSSRSSSSG